MPVEPEGFVLFPDNASPFRGEFSTQRIRLVLPQMMRFRQLGTPILTGSASELESGTGIRIKARLSLITFGVLALLLLLFFESLLIQQDFAMAVFLACALFILALAAYRQFWQQAPSVLQAFEEFFGKYHLQRQ